MKSYVHDELVAEDITSESLIKLWNKIKGTDIIYIEPLLLTILKNAALDYLRHEEVRRSTYQSLADWHSQELSLRITSLESCDPNEIFSEEVEKIIEETLDSMPSQTKQAFILSRFENKMNKEISEIMQISLKGVEYHISKALKLFRISLKDYLPFLLLLITFVK